MHNRPQQMNPAAISISNPTTAWKLEGFWSGPGAPNGKSGICSHALDGGQRYRFLIPNKTEVLVYERQEGAPWARNPYLTLGVGILRRAHSVAHSERYSRYYVADAVLGSVLVFDDRSGQSIPQLAVSNVPEVRALCASDEADLLFYSTDRSESVVGVDLSSMNVKMTIGIKEAYPCRTMCVHRGALYCGTSSKLVAYCLHSGSRMHARDIGSRIKYMPSSVVDGQYVSVVKSAPLNLFSVAAVPGVSAVLCLGTLHSVAILNVDSGIVVAEFTKKSTPSTIPMKLCVTCPGAHEIVACGSEMNGGLFTLHLHMDAASVPQQDSSAQYVPYQPDGPPPPFVPGI